MSGYPDSDQSTITEAVPVEESKRVLKSAWSSIQENRESISAELKQLAERARGVNQSRIEDLRDWFAKPKSYEDALPRQDVLSVCLPLCSISSEKISQREIAGACRIAACSAGREVTASRKILHALFYPLLVIIGASVLGVVFSFLIAPEFETMFGEFGIELPILTSSVLDSAKLVREWSWVLGLWFLGGLLVAWILNRAARKNRPGGLGWIDSQFLTSRDALASWAWHLSLLLEAGIPQREAMLSAGLSANKSWIRRLSTKWSQQNPIPPSDQAAFFPNKKYRLLDYALQIPASNGKVELLRETAEYYWDRNSNVAGWWTQWMVSFLLLMIGITILVLIMSLFMPLLAIVGGLTSAK